MFNKIGGALLIGIGIFLSRIAGLLRERAFAYYFGNSDAGDAFKAALKIPNFLQNLFGEGVLSASFIPVYAQMLADEHNKESGDSNEKIRASDVAMTIGLLLLIITIFLVWLGIFATPFLIDTIAPGFKDEKRELTIKLVQIFFPGTGLVVMSAWCLGILNSHRRFFLSYTAPVLWNFAIIATLIIYGHSSSEFDLAIKTGWGLVAGSFLQLFVQVPATFKLLKLTTIKVVLKSIEVKTIIKNFIPSLISRGVVQISSYIDNILASLLTTGSVSILAYAQTIYLLPISLFGMSLSASELPEMSSITGSKEEIYQKLKTRLQSSIERVCFFIIPSLAVFIVLGDVLISALYQTGKFSNTDTQIVWLVLMGFSIGLLASTQGRLYSSVFYALKDTKTTLRFAIIRIILNSSLAYFFAFVLFPKLNIPLIYHTSGLTIASGLSGWVEFKLLKNRLESIIGAIPKSFSYLSKLFTAALVSAFVSWFIKLAIHHYFHLHPILNAVVIFSFFGILYFSLSYLFKVELAEQIFKRIFNKLRR